MFVGHQGYRGAHAHCRHGSALHWRASKETGDGDWRPSEGTTATQGHTPWRNGHAWTGAHSHREKVHPGNRHSGGNGQRSRGQIWLAGEGRFGHWWSTFVLRCNKYCDLTLEFVSGIMFGGHVWHVSFVDILIPEREKYRSANKFVIQTQSRKNKGPDLNKREIYLNLRWKRQGKWNQVFWKSQHFLLHKWHPSYKHRLHRSPCKEDWVCTGNHYYRWKITLINIIHGANDHRGYGNRIFTNDVMMMTIKLAHSFHWPAFLKTPVIIYALRSDWTSVTEILVVGACACIPDNLWHVNTMGRDVAFSHYSQICLPF